MTNTDYLSEDAVVYLVFLNGLITWNKVADNIDREIVSDKSVCVCEREIEIQLFFYYREARWGDG